MAVSRHFRRLWPALAVVLLAGACGEGPTSPAPPRVTPAPAPPVPPPQPTPPTVILSGVVYVHSFEGARPRAGIALDVSPVGASGLPNVTSDAEGRYRVGVPEGHIVKANVLQDGFSQPCRASLTATADSVLDVHVVPIAILSATQLPPTLPIPDPTVSGVVVERMTDGSVRPVPGVEVFMDYTNNGWVPDAGQRFVTDYEGRYFFCGVKFGEGGLGGALFVWTDPPAYHRVVQQVRAPGVVDIELVRR